MNDFVAALVVIVAGATIALAQASRFARDEAQLMRASFAAHVLCAVLQVLMMRGVYGGGGDLLGYTAWGELLAATMRVDFTQFAPEVVKLLFQVPAAIPADIPAQGTSTGSMGALAGILTFLTGGSAFTLNLCVAILAYFGQVALYRAFRNSFPLENRRRLLVSALLVPSAVFWSSALLKEPVAMIGMGYLVLGLERTLQGVRPGRLAMMVVGGVIVNLVKPYILFAMTIALAAGVYYRQGQLKSRGAKPAQLIAAVFVAGTAYALLARLAPQYSVETFADRAATYQGVGQEVTGGSSYVMGDPSTRSFAGQLVFAPIALATSLFRPALFEAKNPLIFVNALETTAIGVLVFRALRRRSLKQTWALLTGNPILMFGLAFVVVFGTAVGLTTTNLGSLSRYRMPLVPFLWLIALILGAPATQPVAEGPPERRLNSLGARPRGVMAVRSARNLR